ncbi:hypothetical protein Droror1_Dr00027267 [Drosera rotundifolia]
MVRRGEARRCGERLLKTIAIRSGDVYIPRGVAVPALDKDILWEFQPKKLDLREPFNLQKGWLMFFCSPVSPIIFPADLLFLASTNADGVCYIETSNLHGETNLKIKKALKKTWDYLTPDKATKFEGLFLLLNELQVMMNTMNVPSKRSTLERKLDDLILALFATLLVMCLVGAIGRLDDASLHVLSIEKESVSCVKFALMLCVSFDVFTLLSEIQFAA